MITEPNCRKRNYVHYIGIINDDGDETTERPACEAFRNGIPDEIAYGDNKHLKKHPDQDNDIVYEEDPLIREDEDTDL